ncbi:centromere protein Q [Trichosurus vulpecula]|uniref:centromere protein Q n=1 Tax=Trichosurus vulpecula TaxID=9337 RepID=UPI00186B35AD|nr:centromere protein Q [Trichosurus vulpecula]XP_036622100.1 centromere protein Q [Trichosurus vulpecula]
MMPRRAGAKHTTGTESKQESKSQQCKKTGKRKSDNGDTEESEKEVHSTKQMKKQSENPGQHLQETGKNTNMKKKTLKNKVTWQLLSKDKEYFEAMMDSMIQSVLRAEVKEKENTQIHLNCLKERFLQLCETHKVSLGEWNSLKEVSNLYLKEMETLEANEEDLELLQKEAEKEVKATELINENIQNLQDKIRTLESELEEEEEKAKQVLQIDGSKALSLPELPKKSIKAPILHEEILKRIPNQKDILKDLNVMNNSAEMKNMLTFIKEAYKKLDAS